MKGPQVAERAALTPISTAAPVRLALLGRSIRQRRFIEYALAELGVRVVLSGMPDERFLAQLEARMPDVLLVDMEQNSDRCAEFLDHLLERFDLPIVFNDVAALTLNARHQQRWLATLLEKIAGLTAGQTSAVQHTRARQDRDEAHEVWVLGASLGGPQALTRFLGGLPPALPVGFIVAQHLGANFVSLLAGQLDRVTPLPVRVADAGQSIGRGEILIAPVDRRLRVSAGRRVQLCEWAGSSGPFRPCIDQVIEDIALRYGEYAGAIVFSGMAQDGARGCQAVARCGGTVWTQDAESCVISSMPDSVRALGVSSFTGTPEVLAERLVQHVKARDAGPPNR